MNKTLKITTLSFLLFMFCVAGSCILFVTTVSAGWQDDAASLWDDEVPKHYKVFVKTGTNTVISNKSTTPSSPKWVMDNFLPKITTQGLGCDRGNNLATHNFNSVLTFSNCRGLTIQEKTGGENDTWFQQANISYVIGDFDNSETIDIGRGKIVEYGASTKSISNGNRNALAKVDPVLSTGESCDRPNPHYTKSCSLLIYFTRGDAGDFHIILDNTYPSGAHTSGHEYWYSGPKQKQYRTLTFNPNGGSVTDTTPDLRTLISHKSGVNALREYQRGNRANSFPEPTWPGHWFVGWSTQPNGNCAVSRDCIYSVDMFSDITLYAHWTTPPPTPNGFTPVVTPADFEKGTTSVNVTHSIIVNPTAACTVANQVVTKTWSYGGVIGPTGSKSFTVNCGAVGVVNSIAPSDGNSVTITIDNAHNHGNIDVMNAADPGTTYNRTTTIDDTTGTGRITVYEVPYTRFYGHDVHATNGDVIFNTNPTSPDFRGIASASQYAAIIARSTIKMASAAFHGSTNPSAPNGLSVINFTFGYSERDLGNKLPTAATGYTGGVLPTPPVDARGGYYKGDDITIEASNVSKKITVKAKNITINGDITTVLPPGPFNDSTTPVVLLIADDDINISSNVRQIDAVLIAGGEINTCTTNTGAVIPRNQWHTACQNKLVINGAIGAKNINFQRSIGTRLKGNTNEDMARVFNGNMAGDAGNLTEAAEVINYPGYLNFTSFYLLNSGRANYQALFNAPPRL
ncbi:InlB B-repeat-containing protein [Candidatus Saccharibacteria bacterium]|nr:InlB B-repeat-containing protein [Candidatus Saccharibacteria bacterium]